MSLTALDWNLATPIPFSAKKRYYRAANLESSILPDLFDTEHNKSKVQMSRTSKRKVNGSARETAARLIKFCRPGASFIRALFLGSGERGIMGAWGRVDCAFGSDAEVQPNPAP